MEEMAQTLEQLAELERQKAGGRPAEPNQPSDANQ
jgi:hypothetical protein